MSDATGGDRSDRVEGTWSWAASSDVEAERRAEAHRLVGMHVTAVTYMDIDYGFFDRSNGPTGPRFIDDPDEWTEPSWAMPMCDSVDYGIELATDSGTVFSVAWDPPGQIEGIGIREAPLLGGRYAADRDMALWDVTRRSRWTQLLDAPVTDVTLHYRLWGPKARDARWCSRITLTLGAESIEFLLAQGLRDEPYLDLSSDNICVVFPPMQALVERFELRSEC